MSETQSGSLADLPIAELFEAEGDEDVGLDALTAFSEALDAHEKRDWSIMVIWPEEKRYLSRALLFHGEQQSDWVEIDVDVRSWKPKPIRLPAVARRLWRVGVSFDVSCWCDRDHGVHSIQEARYESGSVDGFAGTLATVTDVIDGWLDAGPLPADKWRRRAGFPTASK